MTNQNRVRSMCPFAYFPRPVQTRATETVFARTENVRVSPVGLVTIAQSVYAKPSALEMDFGMNFLESALVITDGKEHGAISKKKSARNARMASALTEIAFAMRALMELHASN